MSKPQNISDLLATLRQRTLAFPELNHPSIESLATWRKQNAGISLL